jgi:choline dehydrogenase-like flavoprotein
MLSLYKSLYFFERITRKAIAMLKNIALGIFGNSIYSVWVKSEILPNSDSKITLLKDGSTLKTRYHHVVSEKSKLEFIRALKILEGELSLARVGELKIKPTILNGTDQILQGQNWHPMGTLRMGIDPKQSACDSDLKLHSAERIYVADASVFPTGSNANPTFTAMALGLRLASYLDDKYKR